VTPDREDPRGLLRLGIAALASGALVGLVGGAFRLTLESLQRHRDALVAWAHQWPTFGWLVPVAAAALAAAAARWLVRFAPEAAGSGVQHVEAVDRGEAAPSRLAALPVKFVGGSLAIGSGLALGREGPTVQMGATLGASLGRLLRMPAEDVRLMHSALAGAGIAVAFNAPLGGAIFTFEEVSRKFRLRLAVAALSSAGAATAVQQLLLGDRHEFSVAALRPPGIGGLLPFLAMGLLIGLLAEAYNRAVVGFLDLFDRWHRWSPLVRAGVVGGVVGLVAWFAPGLVGGGEALSQRILAGGFLPGALLFVLATRWLLGPFSYSASTPGGLFAPLLLVGAATGALFGLAVEAWMPGVGVAPAAYAVVGMATFFNGVVRAPVTGIALVSEMTQGTTLMIPMLIATFAASLSTTWVGSVPIYDTLRLRMLAREGSGSSGPPEGAAP
jgi:CIC family chloride channel protein